MSTGLGIHSRRSWGKPALVASSTIPELRIMTRLAHRFKDRNSKRPKNDRCIRGIRLLPEIFMTMGLERNLATGSPTAKCRPCMRKYTN